MNRRSWIGAIASAIVSLFANRPNASPIQQRTSVKLRRWIGKHDGLIVAFDNPGDWEGGIVPSSSDTISTEPLSIDLIFKRLPSAPQTQPAGETE